MKKILGSKGTSLAKSMRDNVRSKTLSISLDNVSFMVNSSKYYEFWKKYQKGNWEPETLKIFETFLDKDHSYIDIGAWIGSTVLYASHFSKHCYAFEPDPVAFSEIKENVHLNEHLHSKISLYNAGISDKKGSTKLYYPEENKIGNSYSSFLERGKNFVDVDTITLNEFIDQNKIDNCNFIKIDIEGGEFAVLPTMLDYLRKNKPTLLLEIHSQFTKNPKESVDKLAEIFELYHYRYTNKLQKISIQETVDYAIKGGFHLVLSDRLV